eukprot:jgi/Botrbrau1/15445/Bobra.43_2s0070.1
MQVPTAREALPRSYSQPNPFRTLLQAPGEALPRSLSQIVEKAVPKGSPPALPWKAAREAAEAGTRSGAATSSLPWEGARLARNAGKDARIASVEARNGGREAGNPGRKAGNPGREAADAGKEAADAGKEAADAGREAADAGKEAADAGREAADAGREAADAGREAADAGREAADAGKEAADAGREAADAVREAADAGKEAANAGREAGSAGRKAGEGSASLPLKASPQTAVAGLAAAARPLKLRGAEGATAAGAGAGTCVPPLPVGRGQAAPSRCQEIEDGRGSRTLSRASPSPRAGGGIIADGGASAGSASASPPLPGGGSGKVAGRVPWGSAAAPVPPSLGLPRLGSPPCRNCEETTGRHSADPSSALPRGPALRANSQSGAEEGLSPGSILRERGRAGGQSPRASASLPALGPSRAHDAADEPNAAADAGLPSLSTGGRARLEGSASDAASRLAADAPGAYEPGPGRRNQTAFTLDELRRSLGRRDGPGVGAASGLEAEPSRGRSLREGWSVRAGPHFLTPPVEGPVSAHGAGLGALAGTQALPSGNPGILLTSGDRAAELRDAADSSEDDGYESEYTIQARIQARAARAKRRRLMEQRRKPRRGAPPLVAPGAPPLIASGVPPLVASGAPPLIASAPLQPPPVEVSAPPFTLLPVEDGGKKRPPLQPQAQPSKAAGKMDVSKGPYAIVKSKARVGLRAPSPGQAKKNRAKRKSVMKKRMITYYRDKYAADSSGGLPSPSSFASQAGSPQSVDAGVIVAPWGTPAAYLPYPSEEAAKENRAERARLMKSRRNKF